MHKRFLVGLVGLALMLFQPLCAQKEGSVWYFGNHAGLDFKQDFPKPLTNGQTNSSEGVAAISDKNGNLLFYTDGQTVYNRNHTIMMNGEGLSGNTSSTQSSIIVPTPGSATEFYIFTVAKAARVISPNYKGLNFSIVDLAQNAPLGLVTQQKNIPLPGTSNILFTEKITVVKKSDGNYWIIAHQFDTWAFYEYLLTNAGITLQASLTAGLVHYINTNDPSNYNAAGYLKSSPNGDFLVTAIQGMKTFELFSFNNTTGDIRLIAKLPAGNRQNPKDTIGAAYGVEFSPTGNFLYGSSKNDGTLYQWNLSKLDTTSILNSVKFLHDDSSVSCGALQLASNGKIYVAFDNQPYLGVIKAPDFDSCSFVKRGASLFDSIANFRGISRFGLPNIPAAYFKDSIYYSHDCVNDTTTIYLASRDFVDDAPLWFIKGDQIAGDAITYAAKYVFADPGDYKILMVGSKNGIKITRTRTIRIHPLPELDIKDTTYLCSGQPVILHQGNYAFYGITNEAGVYSDTVRSIDQPGLYAVTVTNYEGCTKAVTTRAISKAQPKIERSPKGPDKICPGDTITLTATGADFFKWENPPGVNQNSITVYPDRDTIFSVIGYSGDMCSDTVSIQIEVFKNNKLELGGPLTPCVGDIVELRGQGFEYGSQYTEWTWSTGAVTDYLVINQDYTNLWLSVKDVNGCFYRDSIDVTFQPAMLVNIERSPTGPDTICPGEAITLTATGASFFEWDHEPGKQQNTVIVYPDHDTLFRVTGSNGGTCLVKDSITILVHKVTELKLGPDRVACAGDTIVLRGKEYDPGSIYTEWNWSTGEKTDSLVALQSLSNLHLMVKDKNGCASTDSINITFNPLPVVSSVVKKDITCFGDGNGSLEIKVDGGPLSYQYSINDGNSWSDQSLYSNLSSGDYSAKVKNGANCISLAYPATIREPEQLDKAIKSISPSCPECTDGGIQIQVTGGTKPYSFDWTGLSIHDSICSDIGTGNYHITITDANGCTLGIDYTLIASELFIPNAFSPNGGTRNEKWVIRILENRPDCLVQVYDRSGKLVFYDDQFYEPWDGTYLNQGKKLPAGTYFYRIQIDRKDANKPPQRGTVTILR